MNIPREYWYFLAGWWASFIWNKLYTYLAAHMHWVS